MISLARLTTPARERPSDKVSDNRHRQWWTPADKRGRSAAGYEYYGTGSPRRSLASGRRGHRSSRAHRGHMSAEYRMKR